MIFLARWRAKFASWRAKPDGDILRLDYHRSGDFDHDVAGDDSRDGGPTVFDRVLALNMFGTKTVLLICVVCFILKRTDFLDLALLYSLMNFIGMVALLRFSQYGGFSKVDEVAASTDQPTSSSGGR